MNEKWNAKKDANEFQEKITRHISHGFKLSINNSIFSFNILDTKILIVKRQYPYSKSLFQKFNKKVFHVKIKIKTKIKNIYSSIDERAPIANACMMDEGAHLIS